MSNKGKADTAKLLEPDAGPTQLTTRAAQAQTLWTRINAAKTPAPADIDALKTLLATTPELWSRAYEIGRVVRDVVVKRVTRGVSQASTLAEIELLEGQLGYATAPALERLLIEHILTAHVRLAHAENAYTECVMDGKVGISAALYWEKRLSATQRRYLRAVESLARVRQLTRNAPAVQINIAAPGGQQVNVQQAELGL